MAVAHSMDNIDDSPGRTQHVMTIENIVSRKPPGMLIDKSNDMWGLVGEILM